jgi:hypothetical protein
MFIAGAILVAAGAGMASFATFLFYLWYLPLWVFLLGVVLIWCSSKGVTTKLLWTFLPFVVVIGWHYLWEQLDRTTPETYLIPYNHRGNVRIFFNEECGDKGQVVNGRRLYKIPSNGVLITQLELEYGIVDREYYLVYPNGKRTRIHEYTVWQYDEEYARETGVTLRRDQLAVIDNASAGSGQQAGEKQYFYQQFFVGSYTQLNDSFGYDYEEYFDSVSHRALVACRGR